MREPEKGEYAISIVKNADFNFKVIGKVLDIKPGLDGYEMLAEFKIIGIFYDTGEITPAEIFTIDKSDLIYTDPNNHVEYLL